MRSLLVAVSIASLLAAQDRGPRSARAILRDFDSVSMPSFSAGNDPESLRHFQDAIREGSLKKAELALELFAAHPDHARLPRLMETRWATFNNVTHDHPTVIVETSLLLEDDDVREDLARVALTARTRAITWSPLSTNKERLLAVRELIGADPENERTGVALMDVAQHHIANPRAMRGLCEIALRHWPESAYVGRPAKRWLSMLDRIGQPFVDQLPANLRKRFVAELDDPAPFTVVQLWSGWIMLDRSKRELDAVRGLNEAFGDDVRVVGLIAGDLDSRLADARAAGVDWPQLEIDGDALRAPRQPCYFVLDRGLDIVGIVGSAAAAKLRIRTLTQ